MEKEVEQKYKEAAAYAQRVFRRQAKGSLSKAVTVTYKKGKMVIGYGEKSYGFYVDYGTYDSKVNPYKIPNNAKWSPKGFGPDKKGIEPRFFTVMGKKDLDKFYSILEEAVTIQFELELEKIEL